MFGPATLTLLCLLLLAGIVAQQPLLTLFTSALVLAALLGTLWKRYCLTGVEYRRSLSAPRVPFGGTLELEVEVVNRKPLPLAWLQVRDELPQGVRPVRGRVFPSHRVGRSVLDSVLALRPFERVRQRYRFPCVQRGEFEIGPVRLASGDLFGLVAEEVEVERIDHFLVWPRVVPVSGLGVPPRLPMGDRRTSSWLFEDPTRVAGAREYRPGDPRRRVHWPASVRAQRLQAKVYEPSISRQLVVVLNLHPAEAWTSHAADPDVVERVIMVAASIACRALEHGFQVGLLTNGMHRRGSFDVSVPPASSPGQRERLLDTLGRLQPLAVRPFDVALAGAPAALRFGSTLVVVSAALGASAAAQLQRLHRRGHPTVYVHAGPGAPPAPAHLRGISVCHAGALAGWRDVESLSIQPVPFQAAGPVPVVVRPAAVAV